MKFIISAVALAALAQATYPITGTTVNCRAGPSTDTAIIRTYKKDDKVTITCQINGPDVNGNSIWDHTSDGCYVSDFFVKTGTSKFVAEKCSSTSSSASTDTAAPTTSSSESTATSAEPTVSATSTIAPTGGNSTTTVAPTGSLPTGGSPTSSPPVTAAAAGLEMAAKGLYIALPVALMAMV